MKKAREIAAQVNGAGFKRSAGWLWHQKKRFHVGIRHSRNESQKLWEDYHDQWLAFRRSIIHLRKRDDYTLHNIANMDQTMVQFDCTPNLTDTIRGNRTMPIASAGAKKKGCTVALYAHADGSKLPVLIETGWTKSATPADHPGKCVHHSYPERLDDQRQSPEVVQKGLVAIRGWCSSTSHFRSLQTLHVQHCQGNCRRTLQ